VESTHPSWTLSGPCESCREKVEIPLPIGLDSTNDHALAKWPTDQSPPLTCPHCRRLWPLGATICVYWHREWTGVALGSKHRAIVVLQQIAQWIGAGKEAVEGMPPVIRVFDSMMELSYVIQHPTCSLFRVDLKGCVAPHWDDEVITLTKLADAALQLELGRLAYIILAGIVQEDAEFFFIPKFRDALELTAHASGDIPLRPTDDRKALEDYAEMVAALHPHRAAPQLDDYSVWHDSPLDVRTEAPLEGSVNNIVRDAPSLFNACKIWLRILTAGAMLRGESRAKGRAASIQPREGLTEEKLKVNWRRLTHREREDLLLYFRDISGASLQDAFGLTP
jgi:hypothetical protein